MHEHTNQAMIKNTYIENLTGLNEIIVIHEIDRVNHLGLKSEASWLGLSIKVI